MVFYYSLANNIVIRHVSLLMIMVAVEMGVILWFHGMYASAVRGGYGGGERSQHVANILHQLTGYKIINIMYKRPLSHQCIDGQDKICVNLTIGSLIGRGLVKTIKFVSSSRSALRLFFLSGVKADLTKMVERTEKEDHIVVLDGLKGYLMARPILDDLRKTSNFIVYLSHNFEADYFAGMRWWIERVEREAAETSDLILVASHRDASKYLIDFDLDEEKILVVPNIYPVEFKKRPKLSGKTVAIVAGSQYKWAQNTAKFILKHNLADHILYIGRHHPKIRDPRLMRWEYIPSREEFLSVLSQAHLGINHGVWLGGSNVKRYDYALAGLTIFSGGTGFRGDILPGEIAYTDLYDLAAKLKLITLDEAIELGMQNMTTAMNIYKKMLDELKKKIQI